MRAPEVPRLVYNFADDYETYRKLEDKVKIRDSIPAALSFLQWIN